MTKINMIHKLYLFYNANYTYKYKKGKQTKCQGSMTKNQQLNQLLTICHLTLLAEADGRG